MGCRFFLAICLVSLLALSACGSKSKSVASASYTCAQFQKSLKSKSDNTAGNFVNQLVKKAHLKADAKAARGEITLGVFFACRNKPGTTRPAQRAMAIAKQVEAGKFKLPGSSQPKKKSAK